MGQILIFVTQFGEVAFIEGLLLIAFRNGLQLKKSSLPHEYGFNLEQVVTVLADSCQENMTPPFLKGVAIDAETVVAGQRDKVSRLPRAFSLTYPLFDGNGLLFQPLRLQGCHPSVNGQRCQVWNDAVAGRIGVCLQLFFVVFLN